MCRSEPNERLRHGQPPRVSQLILHGDCNAQASPQTWSSNYSSGRRAPPPSYSPSHTRVHTTLDAPVTKLRHLPAISLRSPHTSQVRSVTNLRSRRNVFLIALAAARRALLYVPPAPRVLGLGLGYGLSLSLSPSLA